jgi:hypothetical protein
VNVNTMTMSVAPRLVAPRLAAVRPVAVRPVAGRVAEAVFAGSYWSTVTVGTTTPQIPCDHAASFVAPHAFTVRNDLKLAPPPRLVPR